MSHSKVGQDFPKPDLPFDGHAAYSTTMANGIEALEVFKQFDMDQRSGNVKEIVAAFNLAGSTELEFHCKSTCLSFLSMSTFAPKERGRQQVLLCCLGVVCEA